MENRTLTSSAKGGATIQGSADIKARILILIFNANKATTIAQLQIMQ